MFGSDEQALFGTVPSDSSGWTVLVLGLVFLTVSARACFRACFRARLGRFLAADVPAAGPDDFLEWAGLVLDNTVSAVVAWATVEKLVFLVLGVGPLLWFGGWLLFYVWLGRPVDMKHHPFVRFPWWPAAVVALTAANRGDNPVGWVLAAWGSIFLLTHLFHFLRVAYGYNPPELPSGYSPSVVPLMGVTAVVVFLNVLYLAGRNDFAFFPLGGLRMVQASYGLYFFGCYLVKVQLPRARSFGWFEDSRWYYMSGGLLTFWRQSGSNARASAIVTTGGLVLATGEAWNANRRERIRLAQEAALEKARLAQERLFHADEMELAYRKSNLSFDRVGNKFYNVQPSGRFSTPRQTSVPSPSKDSDDTTMSSPQEEFDSFGWVSDLTLGGDHSGLFYLLLAGAAVVVFGVLRVGWSWKK